AGEVGLAAVTRDAVAVVEVRLAAAESTRSVDACRDRVLDLTGRAARSRAAGRRVVERDAAIVARLLTGRARTIGQRVERSGERAREEQPDRGDPAGLRRSHLAPQRITRTLAPASERLGESELKPMPDRDADRRLRRRRALVRGPGEIKVSRG